jgi:hypothetical protein
MGCSPYARRAANDATGRERYPSALVEQEFAGRFLFKPDSSPPRRVTDNAPYLAAAGIEK